VFDMARTFSGRAYKHSGGPSLAQKFALAKAIQKPGTRIGILGPDNNVVQWSTLSLDHCSECFFVEVQDDVLACDYDGGHGERAVEGLLTAMESVPAVGPPVVQRSGQPGRYHVLTRIDNAQDYDLLATEAKSLGFDIRRTIRPPSVPHRLGLPVSLVEPADVDEAIRRLERGPQHGQWSRRPYQPLTACPSVPGEWRPLPDYYQALLSLGDLGDGRYLYPNTTKFDPSAAAMAVLCSAACCHWTFEEINAEFEKPANTFGRSALEKHSHGGDGGEAWLARSWANAIIRVTEHDRLCDALLDRAQETLRGTRTAATDLKVITAVIELCRRVHRFDVDLSQRDWLLLSGVGGAKTLRKSKGRLMPLWFTYTPGNRHSDANRYTINSALVPPTVTLKETGAALDMGHDIWRFGALLPNGYRIFQHLLRQGPSTSAEIHVALVLGKPTVRKHLVRLQEWGLCKSDGGIYSALDADLDEVARVHDVAPKGAAQQACFSLERENFAQAQKTAKPEDKIPASWLHIYKRSLACGSPTSALANPARTLVKGNSNLGMSS